MCPELMPVCRSHYNSVDGGRRFQSLARAHGKASTLAFPGVPQTLDSGLWSRVYAASQDLETLWIQLVSVRSPSGRALG